MANSSSANNYNNTSTGTSIPSTVTQVFDQYPYLGQMFAKEVKDCAIANVMDNCVDPPSITQLDNDIVKADIIIEWLLVNEVYERDIQIFLYKTIINYFKVKKCVVAQYPCWTNELYVKYSDYINSFSFSLLP
jgi:hypothetical protein